MKKKNEGVMGLPQVKVTPGPGNGGGDGDHQARPGAEEIFVGYGRGQSPFTILLTGSLQPQELYPRSRVKDEQEIACEMGLFAIEDVIRTGRCDLRAMSICKHNMRIGLGGQGRAEAVKVAIAEKQQKMRMADRAHGIAGGGRDGGMQ